LVADPAPLDRVSEVRLVGNISPVQEPVKEPMETTETADDMVVAATYEEEADAARSNADLSD
jgi:hypothetical protein